MTMTIESDLAYWRIRLHKHDCSHYEEGLMISALVDVFIRDDIWTYRVLECQFISEMDGEVNTRWGDSLRLELLNNSDEDSFVIQTFLMKPVREMVMAKVVKLWTEADGAS